VYLTFKKLSKKILSIGKKEDRKIGRKGGRNEEVGS